MSDPLPKPNEPEPDLDGHFRRLRGHVRRRKKRHANSGSNLVDYDRLLGALKQLQKDCASRPITLEVKQMLAAFIAFLGDDDLR
jgi:hypothetical protein